MSKSIFSLLCCALFLSCAKPTDPESLTPSSGGYSIVGRIQLPGYAEDVEVKDTLAYVAQGEGGLSIVSIADRTKPRLLSTCQEGVRGTSHKLSIKDSTVYVAANTFGVSAVDVSDPLAPHAIASNISLKPAQSLHAFGSYLLAATGEQGVQIADISAPIPNPLGPFSCPGYAIGLTTTPDSARLLVACGEMGLAIFDVHDMQGGRGPYRQVGWTDTPGYASAVATMANRPFAFLACGTAGVQVVDFSDTTNIRVVGSYATGGYAKEIAYSNGRVYVATELRGLQILSVENPAAPRLVGVVGTEYALGVAVDQRHVYVADEDYGLIIIAIPPY